jgi:hypothetical protein
LEREVVPNEGYIEKWPSAHRIKELKGTLVLELDGQL